MPADTHSDLQRAAQRLRDALELRTEEASSQITRSWLVAQQRIDLEVQTLLSKMEAARLAGIEPSPAWLYQQRRLAALTDAIQEQVADWARTAEPAIRDLAYAAAAQASEGARDLAREAARVDLPGVEASFTDLAPENMAAILGHLAPGGPLQDLLVSLGPETAEAAAQTLLQGVLLGKGSAWITRGLAQALDVPRWRAETIARTEALRAYRETSRETYKKSNVVGQWEWNAALDRRTCPACVALHGSLFSLEERLDGHPRCRCAMVPVTKSWAELGMDPALDEMNPRVPTETGPEWLKRQTPQTQRAVLGPGKYDLYANGKADLPDFVARTHNDRWGTMRRERSLRELAEGRNPNYRDAPELSEDDIWEALIRDEAEEAAAVTAKWDRWETGRDRRIGRVTTQAERDRRLTARDIAKRHADDDAELLALWEKRVKDRQAELRQYVPDSKERAKVARTDLTLKNAKEQRDYFKGQADRSADDLRRAQRALDEVGAEDLPEWNPDNPLEFYGDRVKFHDHSASSERWARDLEDHLDPHHHQTLRDHFAESDHGGIYMGDKSVPHLDSLRDELPSGETPRGYTPGKTYDDCHGVYSPSTRVVGCGHASHGLDAHHSTILHEAGHALDHAYGNASMGPAWRTAYDSIPADVADSMMPYYRPAGNAAGYLQEAWAEGFQAWTRVRFQPLEVQARELALDLVTGLRPLTDAEVQAMIPLARYFSDLYASRRVLP